jgi:hypothetical protein
MSPQPVWKRRLGTRIGPIGWQGLEFVKGLDNRCRITGIDQNVTKSPPSSYPQHLPEAELKQSDLGKFVEETRLMFHFLHVPEQNFHPNGAGAPDHKPIGFDYVTGGSAQPQRSNNKHRQKGCHLEKSPGPDQIFETCRPA